MHIAACAVVAALLLAACGREAPTPVPTQRVSQAEAAEQARKHLPVFLDHLSQQHPHDAKFWLIIEMPPEGKRKSARLRMTDIVPDAAGLRATVAEADKNWPEFPVGTPISFPGSIAYDWGFTRKNMAIGFFQLRAEMCRTGRLLSNTEGRTPQAEAVRIGAMQALHAFGGCKGIDLESDIRTADAQS